MGLLRRKLQLKGTMARITRRKYEEMVKPAALRIKPGQIIGHRMVASPPTTQNISIRARSAVRR